MIHGSIFGNIRDKRPEVLPPVGFPDLVSCLIDEAIECDPSSKADQVCVSPAVYRTGESRCKAGAISWNWFAADIDNKAGNRTGSTIDDIKKVMMGHGSPWFIYTTASSQTSAQCFRLMFPLDRAVTNEEFDGVWRAFAEFLPMDPQTKDISRLFIVPRRWIGRDNRFDYDLSGQPLEVNQVLRRYPPLPPSISRLPSAALKFASPSRAATNSAVPSLSAPYVPQTAIDEACVAPAGGRMYRFLVRVAFNALRKGYAIDSSDLAIIGKELALHLGRGTSDIGHDARSAHAYAAKHYVDDNAARSHRRRSVTVPKAFR